VDRDPGKVMVERPGVDAVAPLQVGKTTSFQVHSAGQYPTLQPALTFSSKETRIKISNHRKITTNYKINYRL